MKNAIGYVSIADAVSWNLSLASLINAANVTIQPEEIVEAVQAAMDFTSS